MRSTAACSHRRPSERSDISHHSGQDAPAIAMASSDFGAYRPVQRTAQIVEDRRIAGNQTASLVVSHSTVARSMQTEDMTGVIVVRQFRIRRCFSFSAAKARVVSSRR